MLLFKGPKAPKIVSIEQDKRKRDARNAESDLQTKICIWLKKTYPGILFISDFAAGMQLSPFLAGLRSLHACDAKMVDLIILMPSKADLIYNYHALCLELKTGADKVFMQDGLTLLKNDHILAQYETIKQLRSLNYAACFACGEVQIKQLIVDYMNGVYKNPVYIERVLYI